MSCSSNSARGKPVKLDRWLTIQNQLQREATINGTWYSAVCKTLKWQAAVFATILVMLPRLVVADVSSRRDGMLELASTVHPRNYDCHGNLSFAFLHPVAPHYSTFLKFDAAH